MTASNWATDLLPLLSTLFWVLCGVLGVVVFAALVTFISVRVFDLVRSFIRHRRNQQR